MSTQAIILVPLFKGLTVTTNGTALSKSTLDLNVPQVRNLLPQAAGLFIIGLTENSVSTDFDWNVAFISGFDQAHPAAAIDIGSSALDSASGMRTAEYTTMTNFLLETRLQLWWRNKAGISGAKTAQLSAVLGVHLLTA